MPWEVGQIQRLLSGSIKQMHHDGSEQERGLALRHRRNATKPRFD
jgi:hypothetical protein